MARRARFTLLLLLGVVLGGCSGAGRGTQAPVWEQPFDPGRPAFFAEAVGTSAHGMPGASLHVGIVPATLSFARADSAFVARYDLVVRVYDASGRQHLAEHVYRDTLTRSAFEATLAYAPHVVVQRLALEAGAYRLRLTLADAATARHAEREVRVTVPGREAGAPLALSALWFEAAAPGDTLRPVVQPVIPAGLDSLRGVVQVRPGSDGAPLEVRSILLRVPSDQAVPALPYWFMPPPGSLAYLGVRPDPPDTVRVTRARFVAGGEPLAAVLPVRDLEVGVYRLVLEVGAPGVAAQRVERAFAVQRPDFPEVTTLGQMVEALTYLAERRELEAIRQAPTPEARRRAFDAFWGERVQRRVLAANVIKLYYGRVEEANLFFTSFKAGWKTDRGMVYVVLGPPLYVEQRPDAEVWHYSYASDAGPSTFTFRKVPVPTSLGFEQYVLERQPYYEARWLKALKEWRKGTML